MKTLVFNGWAAGYEVWDLCAFRHDWVFSYIDQLDGLPERVLDDSESAVLVGFSMGGSSALRMWLRYPDKIRGMVLISTTPRMMEQRDEGWVGMNERRLKALRLGTRMLFGGDPSPLYDEDNMDRGLAYLRRVDLRKDMLARQPVTEMPVRILQSERDGIVRPDNAQFLKRIFPQSEIVMVPGGEHVLPISVPELVDSAVEGVMEELDERNSL